MEEIHRYKSSFPVIGRPIEPVSLEYRQALASIANGKPSLTQAEIDKRVVDYRAQHAASYTKLQQSGVSDDSLASALYVYTPDQVTSVADFVQVPSSSGVSETFIGSEFLIFVEMVALLGRDYIAAKAIQLVVTPINYIRGHLDAITERERNHEELLNLLRS